MLAVVCYLPTDVCCVLSAVCCLPCVVCCLLSAVCCPLPAVCFVLSVVLIGDLWLRCRADMFQIHSRLFLAFMMMDLEYCRLFIRRLTPRRHQRVLYLVRAHHKDLGMCIVSWPRSRRRCRCMRMHAPCCMGYIEPRLQPRHAFHKSPSLTLRLHLRKE